MVGESHRGRWTARSLEHRQQPFVALPAFCTQGALYRIPRTIHLEPGLLLEDAGRTLSDSASATLGIAYAIGYHAQDVVPEETNDEVDDLLDRAVVVEFLRRLRLMLHGRLRLPREQTAVLDDSNEVSVHVASS